jgi:hypothetical protein
VAECVGYGKLRKQVSGNDFQDQISYFLLPAFAIKFQMSVKGSRGFGRIITAGRFKRCASVFYRHFISCTPRDSPLGVPNSNKASQIFLQALLFRLSAKALETTELCKGRLC